MLLGALAITDRLARWPVEARAALVGAAVGALAWFAPDLAGGGDNLTQRALDGTEVLVLLPLLYLLRLFLGAAPTPPERRAACSRLSSFSARKWVFSLAGC